MTDTRPGPTAIDGAALPFFAPKNSTAPPAAATARPEAPSAVFDDVDTARRRRHGDVVATARVQETVKRHRHPADEQRNAGPEIGGWNLDALLLRLWCRLIERRVRDALAQVTGKPRVISPSTSSHATPIRNSLMSSTSWPEWLARILSSCRARTTIKEHGARGFSRARNTARGFSRSRNTGARGFSRARAKMTSATMATVSQNAGHPVRRLLWIVVPAWWSEPPPGTAFRTPAGTVGRTSSSSVSIPCAPIDSAATATRRRRRRARRAGGARPALRAGGDGGAAHPARAHLADDRNVSRLPRGARQRRVLSGRS